jgi:hypothetical protein
MTMTYLKYTLPLILLLLFNSSCETDDDPIPEQFETTFSIEEIDDSGVTGEITFAKTEDNRTLITIDLNGTQAGNTHPVRIHSTSPEQDGPVVVELNPVVGATGRSETLVSVLDDGTATVYEDWVSFDGYVLIYESEANLDTQLAIGLLGSNIPNIPGG